MLAVNLAHTEIWPRNERLLLPLNPADSGDLFFRFGFLEQHSIYLSQEDLLNESTSLAGVSFDIGVPNRRAPLPIPNADPSKWILPVLPQPSFTSAPSPTAPPWWDTVLSKATTLDLDLIIDVGRLLPDYMGIDRRVFEYVDQVYLLVTSEWELRKAQVVASKYSQKIVIVLVGAMAMNESEVVSFGFKKTLEMPWSKKIEDEFARVTIATHGKPRVMRPYLELLAEMTHE